MEFSQAPTNQAVQFQTRHQVRTALVQALPLAPTLETDQETQT